MSAMDMTASRTYYTPAYTFTRPADTTAYTAGDLVANNVTAGSVVPISWVMPLGATFAVHGIRIFKSTTVATNASFRLHLYAALPTVANGDNGAWSSSQASMYLGNISATMLAFTDGCSFASPIIPVISLNICRGTVAARTIYGLLEVTAAYTPGSAETFSTQLIVA